MKILCWNIAGIRASLKRRNFDFLINSEYDVICIQETKATREQGEKALSDNLKEIRYLFENNKLPVIDNVFSNDIIKFIKENVNVDTVPIQCQEDGYKEWKPKYKKIGDLNSFLNILDKKDKPTLGKVSDLFSKIENTINNFVHNILGYKVLSVSRTYRFTMTLRENLHFDNFEPTRPGIGFLRVFVNLDEDERIWNNSLNIYY